MKPLVCDIPYPSTDGIATDTRSGQILSFAYATQKGELNAILQYLYHEVFLRKHDGEFADTMLQIAMAEMKHLHLLAETMEKLGINPKYVQQPNGRTFFDTSKVSQSVTPKKMLLDDIQGEMTTISEYNKMLFVLKNEKVAAIVQRIVLDEQLHLETLRRMLEKV